MLKKSKFKSITIYSHEIIELQIGRDRHTNVVWVSSFQFEINRAQAAIILRRLAKPIPIMLKVTKKMLMSGIRTDTHYCPIALAAKAIGFTKVTVNPRALCGTYNSQWVIAELPESAISLIKTFDQTGKGEELEFEINPIAFPF